MRCSTVRPFGSWVSDKKDGKLTAQVRSSRMMHWRRIAVLTGLLVCQACASSPEPAPGQRPSPWVLVDRFDAGLDQWTHIDVDNRTDPYVSDPQIADIRLDARTGDHFLLTKPAADGVVGNRKAIGFVALPVAIPVGQTFTLHLRFSVQRFPNNQSFGLSNVSAAEIPRLHYDAFEPMIRVTDKFESDGYKNSGALQVLSGGERRYSDIWNPSAGTFAQPLRTDEWYDVWVVVNNAPAEQSGQRYDVYLRGGEFRHQSLVHENAPFRMGRTQPLKFFMTLCNTGPHDKPYGNGGVRYDDIYIAPTKELSSPLSYRSESE